MTDLETVSVSILERPYQVSCRREERAALEAAARHLDQRMREIRGAGRVIGMDRIAVMAALNITHELLSERGGCEARDQRIVALGRRLDGVLGELDLPST
jgi:cell division protein ZapA